MTKPSDRDVGGKPVLRLGNVSTPTLSIYRPAAEKANGMAVLVCPGGGYNILAWDLEGQEICDWLNGQGITGLLLKYRVPKRPGLEKHTVALQDAQRAMGLVRQSAKEWGVDPKRVGIIGFSAGGHVAAALVHHSDDRTYPKVDGADALSCRPDFSLLIYPAYLTVKEENDRIAPELNITSNTPPAFIVMAEDDVVRIESVLNYALALKRVNAPFELHTYTSGGHGYGLRQTAEPITGWPALGSAWLQRVRQ